MSLAIDDRAFFVDDLNDPKALLALELLGDHLEIKIP